MWFWGEGKVRCLWLRWVDSLAYALDRCSGAIQSARRANSMATGTHQADPITYTIDISQEHNYDAPRQVVGECERT